MSKALRICVFATAFLFVSVGSADWHKAEGPAPYNPEYSEEAAAQHQGEPIVQPPLGPIDDPGRPDHGGYTNSDDGSTALVKVSHIDGTQALAEAETSLLSGGPHKPWLMPAVGLGCALLAIALVWRVRAWSEKTAPPKRKIRRRV